MKLLKFSMKFNLSPINHGSVAKWHSIWNVTNYILLEIHPFLTKNHDDGRKFTYQNNLRIWTTQQPPPTDGGFLKWWVSPTNPWVFLLEMIMTWGVKWGYRHLRKHQISQQRPRQLGTTVSQVVRRRVPEVWNLEFWGKGHGGQHEFWSRFFLSFKRW